MHFVTGFVQRKLYLEHMNVAHSPILQNWTSFGFGRPQEKKNSKELPT